MGFSKDCICTGTDLGEATVAPPATTNDYAIPIKSETSFFIAEELRNDILNRNVLTLLQPDPVQYPDLPQEVDSYHELFPLEPISNQVSESIASSLFNVTQS